MSDPLGPPDDAGTELSPDEREGLVPSYITLRRELNAAEQSNIEEGVEWAEPRKDRDVLDETFLKTLHKRMYGNVWRWAGDFRTTGKNVGTDAYRIATELRQLVDDCRFQVANRSFPVDEIAARFHHRLVQIHCFPNGNGRHARVATDLLLKQLGHRPFTWGSANLADAGEVRSRYIAALRAADSHDYEPLLAFVRT